MAATLLFEEHFEGNSLSNLWLPKPYEFGAPATTGFKDAAGSNWNTNPAQHPQHNPFAVANSVLTITAKRLPPDMAATVHAVDANVGWVSGYIVSNHNLNLSWRFGYFEWLARFPTLARGMFPALWLFNNKPDGTGTVGKEGAEIDCLEIFGEATGSPWASGWHNKPTPGSSDNIGYWGGSNAAQWHTYGVEWTPTAITIYQDGTPKGSLTGPNAEWFQNADLGIRINLAIDPIWEAPQSSLRRTTTGDPAPGFEFKMEVDYVRVYDKRPT